MPATTLRARIRSGSCPQIRHAPPSRRWMTPSIPTGMNVMGHLADEAHRLWASIVNKAAMRDLLSVRGGGSGGVLPKYLIGVNYTLDDVKGLKAEGGSARVAAATALIEGRGGTVESFYFAFGDTDVYLIVDMPDTASVAAAATARCPTPSDAPAHWSASSRIRWPSLPNVPGSVVVTSRRVRR
jgi:uncharacterized protein with GYD domain